MYVCVPRNMTQAVGMYNTLLQSNDPAIDDRMSEWIPAERKIPSILLEFTVPLGVPEIIKEGTDITIVSYGSTLRIVQEAAEMLRNIGDQLRNYRCANFTCLSIFIIQFLDSLKKTNRIVFIDEDVPGGAAAYMFNKVMEEQGGYRWLDVAPRTITAKAHRPSYGSDGDYFSKPNAEEIEAVIKEMMAE